MALILPLRTRGQVVGISLIDEADAYLLDDQRWTLRSDGYCCRWLSPKGCLLLHRHIMQPPEGMQVDHINGDRADNRRSNMRLVKGADNALNLTRDCRRQMGLRGVTFYKKTRRWRASVQMRRTRQHLGYYATADEAHAVAAHARQSLGFPITTGEERRIAKWLVCPDPGANHIATLLSRLEAVA